MSGVADRPDDVAAQLGAGADRTARDVSRFIKIRRAPVDGSAPGPFGGRRLRLRRTIVVMTLKLQLEQEDDGHWIAEVAELPGTLVYGASAEEATAKAKALALHVLADRLEHGETDADLGDIAFVAA